MAEDNFYNLTEVVKSNGKKTKQNFIWKSQEVFRLQFVYTLSYVPLFHLRFWLMNYKCIPRICKAAWDLVVRALEPVGRASSGLKILHRDCMSGAEGSLESATTAL